MVNPMYMVIFHYQKSDNTFAILYDEYHIPLKSGYSSYEILYSTYSVVDRMKKSGAVTGGGLHSTEFYKKLDPYGGFILIDRFVYMEDSDDSTD